ncbi:hypothetical protein Taro_013434 [Colocasia esculenta]|uniref:Uncharacterized protein n=1 Tax=Colocasia esculenta TaxID=4460 RepID=A0A843UC24_COLES|nr:hypothetical protein [Colocasia esculenta]
MNRQVCRVLGSHMGCALPVWYMEVVPGTKGFAKNPLWHRSALCRGHTTPCNMPPPCFLDSPGRGAFCNFWGFFEIFWAFGGHGRRPPASSAPSTAAGGGAGAGGRRRLGFHPSRMPPPFGRRGRPRPGCPRVAHGQRAGPPAVQKKLEAVAIWSSSPGQCAKLVMGACKSCCGGQICLGGKAVYGACCTSGVAAVCSDGGHVLLELTRAEAGRCWLLELAEVRCASLAIWACRAGDPGAELERNQEGPGGYLRTPRAMRVKGFSLVIFGFSSSVLRSFHLFICAVESDLGMLQRKVQSDQGNPSLAHSGLSGIPEVAENN